MITLQEILRHYPPSLTSFPRNLLREYIQYKILESIFNSPYAERLSFLGGTALRIVYGNQRFSEDLDFDNFGLTTNDFDAIAKHVKDALGHEGYDVRTQNILKGAFRCNLKIPRLLFEHALSPFEEEKVLIQLDTVAHGFAYVPERKLINKFDVFTQIYVTPLDILLSQKIYAALNRKRAKGRDFYDIVFLLSLTTPQYGYLREKLNIKDAGELRQRLVEYGRTLNFTKLAQDVLPFLFQAQANKTVLLFLEYIAQARLE